MGEKGEERPKERANQMRGKWSLSKIITINVLHI